MGDYTVTRLRRNRNRWGCALSVEKSSAAKNAAQNPGNCLRNTPKLARGGHFSGTFCRHMPLNHNWRSQTYKHNEVEMKKATQRLVWGWGIAAALVAGSASAASWQDQLSSAASQLSQQNSGTTTTSNTQNGGLSLSSLSGLLNGGDKAVSANSMTNAAGVMEYCVQHNVVDNNVKSVKDQVLSKLGLSSTTAQQQKTDYQQGLQGLLNTGNGQQLNLQSLSNSPMGEKLKTKACDVVLKQGKKYIGM